MKPKFLSLNSEVPADVYWDQALLKDLFKDLPEGDRQIVVIPGAYQDIDDINMELKQYPKVLVIITSDEENKFPTDQLFHPNMILYVNYPSLEKHQNVDRFLPIGYSPYGTPEFTTKKLPWFFAGQINNHSRHELVRVLRDMSGGKLIESKGFSQGLEKKDYIQQMEYASVVPAPSGHVSPDSFRLYEALEMGAIPIADSPGFWQMLFDSHPFPALSDWGALKELIENLKDRPEVGNKCFAWWQRQKRQIKYNLEDDTSSPRDDLTVLVPTSPIPSHPRTDIIDQTVQSIRERLPKAEIILMIDGVREEQEHYLPNYTEYTRRILWKANHEWKNVYPLLFESHHHQANMTREALRHVRTPCILFIEHDTPLHANIPFHPIIDKIKSGGANVVRLMHEANILEPHKYLMLDEGNIYTRTAQWSQRPHFASTEYYRHIIDEYFLPSSNTMIEDLMHGVVMNAHQTRGQAGWNEHKLWIYTPSGDMKRSLNLDGREDDEKFPMKFA